LISHFATSSWEGIRTQHCSPCLSSLNPLAMLPLEHQQFVFFVEICGPTLYFLLCILWFFHPVTLLLCHPSFPLATPTSGFLLNFMFSYASIRYIYQQLVLRPDGACPVSTIFCWILSEVSIFFLLFSPIDLLCFLWFSLITT